MVMRVNGIGSQRAVVSLNIIHASMYLYLRARADDIE